MARTVGLYLPAGVDPPGLRPAPPAPRMFDPRPHRNVGTVGVRSSTREWDNRLIATAVELGCPRDIAEQARVYPPARYALLQLWCRVQDAAEGDRSAREAVDRCRVAFRSAALNRPGEALSALEQPAHARELQSLMGLD
jgi:hypothetical protein